MTSKERVLTSVAGAEPDRVPLDFSANPPTLQRLMGDYGVSDYAGLLERLHVDIVDLRGVVDPLYHGPRPKQITLDGGIVENFWGMRTKIMQTATGPEDCYCDFILRECTSVAELERHPWPSVDWFDFSDFSARLEAWRGYAVMASGPSVWQHASFLRGMDNLLVDLVADPDIATFLMDRFTNFYVEFFDLMIRKAEGKIDILRIADDIGMQDRLLISPEQLETFLVPRLKKLIDMAHSHGVKVMFHSCGAIVPFIERLIAIGVDILDPIQVRAKGMDPAFLKRTFGRRLCLHGAIDTQYVLPRGTPGQVRQTVRDMIRVLAPGGGFILCPSHVLQSDVPTENVAALYETGYRQGVYAKA